MRSLVLTDRHNNYTEIQKERRTGLFSSYYYLFVPNRTKARSAASIILRGANDFMVDEMERSMHDALCVVKRVLESKMVVPGGGAVEAALSIYLENFATSLVRANSVVLLGQRTVYIYRVTQTIQKLCCERVFVASELFNIYIQWFGCKRNLLVISSYILSCR